MGEQFRAENRDEIEKSSGRSARRSSARCRGCATSCAAAWKSGRRSSARSGRTGDHERRDRTAGTTAKPDRDPGDDDDDSSGR